MFSNCGCKDCLTDDKNGWKSTSGEEITGHWGGRGKEESKCNDGEVPLTLQHSPPRSE